MLNQNRNDKVKKMAIAGMLVAVGILVPMFAPRILLEPASYTLGVHAVIFMAMFISPMMAVAVALGTTLGFAMTGLPLVIVFRAASHVIFAYGGAYYLHNIAKESLSFIKMRIFSFVIGVVHAVCEVIAVSLFYFGGAGFNQGFFVSVILLVGVGSVVHSMIDFEIAWLIVQPMKRQRNLAALFARA